MAGFFVCTGSLSILVLCNTQQAHVRSNLPLGMAYGSMMIVYDYTSARRKTQENFCPNASIIVQRLGPVYSSTILKPVTLR